MCQSLAKVRSVMFVHMRCQKCLFKHNKIYTRGVWPPFLIFSLFNVWWAALGSCHSATFLGSSGQPILSEIYRNLFYLTQIMPAGSHPVSVMKNLDVGNWTCDGLEVMLMWPQTSQWGSIWPQCGILYFDTLLNVIFHIFFSLIPAFMNICIYLL